MACEQNSAQRQDTQHIDPRDMFQNHVIVDAAHRQGKDATQRNPVNLLPVLGRENGVSRRAVYLSDTDGRNRQSDGEQDPVEIAIA